MRSARKLQVLQNFSEIGPALCIEGVDLARRPLFGGDLLHVDKAALFDPYQQRIDSSFRDVGKIPDRGATP